MRHVIFFILLYIPLSTFAAITQADLQGHWVGTLTDSAATTVYKLDFVVDNAGPITGTGDGAPMNSSTLLVQDRSADTVKGGLHWFYVDTGVYFKWTAIRALLANGQLSLTGPVAGSAYIAPMPPRDTGTWTLSITGGNGSVAPVMPSGNISFIVKQGKEEKSDFSVDLKVPDVPKTLSGVTLTINSASFPVSIEQVKIAKGAIRLNVRGLNLISLLAINMSSVTQSIGVPLTLVGLDSGGNATTFIDGTVTFNVFVKNGKAKGSRAKP